MRALVQRAAEARVRVDGRVVGEIGPGVCCLVGVTHDDDRAAVKLASKLWHLPTAQYPGHTTPTIPARFTRALGRTAVRMRRATRLSESRVADLRERSAHRW